MTVKDETMSELPQMTADGLLKWAPNWLPIDLAPKNGAWIWGYTPDGHGVPDSQPVRWLDEHPAKHNGVTVRPAGWYGDGFDRDRPVNPTHWLPMPQAPLER